MTAGEECENFAQRIADEQHGSKHRHREQQRNEDLADEIFLECFQRMLSRAKWRIYGVVKSQFIKKPCCNHNW